MRSVCSPIRSLSTTSALDARPSAGAPQAEQDSMGDAPVNDLLNRHVSKVSHPSAARLDRRLQPLDARNELCLADALFEVMNHQLPPSGRFEGGGNEPVHGWSA